MVVTYPATIQPYRRAYNQRGCSVVVSMKRLAVAVLVAGLGAGVLSAQQQAPSGPPPVTFRAEVNYVEVDAFVTDQQGNVVTDPS